MEDVQPSFGWFTSSAVVPLVSVCDYYLLHCLIRSLSHIHTLTEHTIQLVIRQARGFFFVLSYLQNATTTTTRNGIQPLHNKTEEKDET